jgi:5-formyltetrahydrofolate cyclo-ligase
MNKSQCRKFIKNRLNAISEIRRQNAAFNILKQFGNLENKNILSFASTQLEINLWPLNKKLLKKNNLILPKIVKDELKIFSVDSIELLRKSEFGILEPDSNLCHEIELNKVDLIFIPGIAFDIENNRLGYGKGFYDKFLHNYFKSKIGLCFKEQLLNKVPTEPHDQKIDKLFYF